MMKKFWPLLLLLIPHQAIHAQELHHAPTVEQCRTDHKLWSDKVKKLWQAEAKGDAASIILQESISLKELTYRGLEMIDCRGRDPQLSDIYNKTSAEITFARTRRMARFLERHDLYKQFEAEDEQGKR